MNRARITITLSAVAVLSAAVLGCSGSDDEEDTRGNTDEPAAGGGAGRAMNTGPEDWQPRPGTYSIESCPGADPKPELLASLPTCDACPEAHCVPSSDAGDNVPGCPDDGSGAAGKCIPDPIVLGAGKYNYAKCHFAVLDTDGACVPSCFITSDRTFLFQQDCAAGELCVPCVTPGDDPSENLCDDMCGG